MDQDPAATPSLDEVRARIDALDADLLRLLDERALLAKAVAAAKAASGPAQGFGLRPDREAMIVRALLAKPRQAAGDALVVRIWRELMADSLSRQGPFHLAVWGGPQTPRAVELARLRFGAAPPLRSFSKVEDALAAARAPGGVGVLALNPDNAWWGRLLAEPNLRVFAVLPCLTRWGPPAAFAVADVPVEPTGDDETFWITDAAGPASAIEEALGRDGVAARLLVEAGGLKLFALAGFYMPGDERLARAPGRLTGVVGASPRPFDAAAHGV